MKTQYLERTQGKLAFDDRGTGPLIICVPSPDDRRRGPLSTRGDARAGRTYAHLVLPIVTGASITK